MAMNSVSDKTALLRGALAPWDERAWENFRDAHPDASSYLLDAVAAGVTNAEIREYCEAEGYHRRVADWLVHAAEHLRRGMAQGAEPEPLGPIDLPTAPKELVERDTGRGWATPAQRVAGTR